MGLKTQPAYIGQTGYLHPVELDRNLIEGMFGGRTGALRVGDLLVSPGVGTRAVQVAAGRYHIVGVENAQQGSYFAWSDGLDTFLLASTATNPRIDTILLRIYDDQYGTISGSPRAEFAVVQGVAAASPTARPDSDFNVGGSFYVPGAWARIADVRVNVGDTTIPSGQITNVNRYVRWGTHTVCTSTTRPTDPAVGDTVDETNTGFFRRWDGTSWVQARAWRAATQLGSTAASITLSNIPSTLRTLRATWSLKGTNATQVVNARCRINGVTSNYFYNRTTLNGSTQSHGADDQGNTYFPIALIATTTSAVAESMGGGVIEFHGWHTPNNKRCQVNWRSGVYAQGAPQAYYEHGQGMYHNAGPLTSLEFAATAGNLVADSWVALEGWE